MAIFLAHASMASWPDGLAMLKDGAHDIPLWPLAHQGAHGWLEVLIGLQLIDLTELMQQPMPESSVGQAKSKLNKHIFKYETYQLINSTQNLSNPSRLLILWYPLIISSYVASAGSWIWNIWDLMAALMFSTTSWISSCDFLPASL